MTSLANSTDLVRIANGGTQARTAAQARINLAAPGLADNNAFTGTNTFAGSTSLNGSTSLAGAIYVLTGSGPQINQLDFSALHTRILTFLDEDQNVPASLPGYSVQGRTTSITSTAVATNAGNYLLTVYAVAAVSTLGVLTVTATFNDGRAAQSINVINAASLSALGAPAVASTVIHLATGSLAFSTTVGGTLTYDLYIGLVRQS